MNKRELDQAIDEALRQHKKIKRVVLSTQDLMSILQHLHMFNYVPDDIAGIGRREYRGVMLVSADE